MLIKSGAKVNSKTIKTSIVLSAREAGGVANTTYADCDTPLHIAVKNGQEEATKVLLKYGANVNEKGDNNSTPLHLASLYGHSNIMKILIENKADVHAKNKYDRSPLHYAAEKKTPDAINFLIKHGAKIEDKDEDGNTPLFNAVMYGHNSTIQSLVKEHKANIHAKNKDGNTPLHCAVINDVPEAIKTLVELGADLNAKGYHDYTPLHYAVKNDHYEIVWILLKNGAEANPKDYKNKPLLQKPMHPAVKEALIEHGAEVQAENNDGTKSELPTQVKQSQSNEKSPESNINNRYAMNWGDKNANNANESNDNLLGDAAHIKPPGF